MAAPETVSGDAATVCTTIRSVRGAAALRRAVARRLRGAGLARVYLDRARGRAYTVRERLRRVAITSTPFEPVAFHNQRDPGNGHPLAALLEKPSRDYPSRLA